MDIFLSWSGDRSRAVAEEFNRWLPEVIQSLKPWHSKDIEKGRRWDGGISDQLDSSNVGIICLTSDNLESPWIHFEAGALSKKKEEALVCTFLLDVSPSEVRPPLGNFQHTEFNYDDVFKLLQDINSRNPVSGMALPVDRLKSAFERCWSDFASNLESIKKKGPKGSTRNIRSERDILEEVLEGVRRTEGNSQTLLSSFRRLSVRERFESHKGDRLPELAKVGGLRGQVSVAYPDSDAPVQDFHITPAKVARDSLSRHEKTLKSDQAEAVFHYVVELLTSKVCSDYDDALSRAMKEVGV